MATFMLLIHNPAVITANSVEGKYLSSDFMMQEPILAQSVPAKLG
jgi:hypothetical protein